MASATRVPAGTRPGSALLGSYRNDHLAGAIGAPELARRAAAYQPGMRGEWHTLRAVADHGSRLDTHRLDELIARASRRSGALEELRTRAVSAVSGTPESSAATTRSAVFGTPESSAATTRDFPAQE